MKVSIAEARANLSKLLHAAGQGKEVIITDHNEPKFRVVPIEPAFPLPPEGNYDKFMKEFRPIRQKKSAKAGAEMIREERDER